MLSVCMITYNHEAFIAEAIESVLRQTTTFPVQLVIGEDQSTDGTLALCIDFKKRFPDRIRLLPAAENLGMMKNFMRTLLACDGDYVAFIEGDDYWTDNLKLQKQVDFLQQHPQYKACFHNALKLWTANGWSEKILSRKMLGRDTFNTENLLGQWFIPSASIVFANRPRFQFPEWFEHCKSGDIPFLLLLSLQGPLQYIDEVMSVYRVHGGGISGKYLGYEKIIAMIFIYETFNIHTGFRFHKKIREAMQYEIDYHYPKQKSEVAPQPLRTGIAKWIHKKLQRT